MKTVGDLRKQLAKFSDDTVLEFTLGDWKEIEAREVLVGGLEEKPTAWFYFMEKPE